MTTKKYLFLVLLGVIVFLPFLSQMGRQKENNKCIFCDIANGREPNTELVVDGGDFVVFKDIKPASTYHYLAVPKQHIESILSLHKTDIDLVNRMEAALQNYYKSKGVNTTDALFGFHVPPFTSVKHLHMHGIAPASAMSFMNRLVFKAGTYWFKNTNETREYLENKCT